VKTISDKVVRHSLAQMIGGGHLFERKFCALEILRFFIFCRFVWKLPIHAHFGEFWGHIFPKYGHPSF